MPNTFRFYVAVLCLVAGFSPLSAGGPVNLAVAGLDYASGAGGDRVALEGDGLNADGVTRVYFGDAEASEVLVSATGEGRFTLDCTTPAHHGGLCDITVVNPDGSSATLPDAFVFVPKTFDPLVTGALPCASPTAGGKTVFVVGQAAGLPFGSYALTVGGTPITNVREYRIPGCIPLYSGVAPAHAEGLYGFGILGFGELMANCFVYTDSTGPVLLKCAPSSDWDVGGGEVRIIAANLAVSDPPVVTFGGVPAANVKVHPDFGGYLTCTAPPHGVGVVDITVTNPDSQSATLSGAFTYNVTSTPVPLSVTPNQGMGFQRNYVTVTGSGFSKLGTTRVYFGGVEAVGSPLGGNVSVIDDTRLTCASPVHEPGTVDVTVVNPGGGSGTLKNGYTFLPPLTPAPAGISPDSGQEAGGTRVTITGTGFSPSGTVAVSFGGARATGLTLTEAGAGNYSISCTTPAHAPGPVDVVITNPGNTTGTLAGAFTYFPQPPPTPVSISPVEGSSLGGTTATITGFGFIPSGYHQVYFGDVPATNVTCPNDQTLTCTTPSHPAGMVDITVTVGGKTGPVLAGGFTYIDAPAPEITDVLPGSVPSNGGVTILIYGTGFGYPLTSGVRVFFGEAEAYQVAVQSSTSLQCQAPSHAPGPVDVKLINPDGKTSVLSGAFTYGDSPAPQLVALSPVRGIVCGGTLARLEGKYFSDRWGVYPKVLFGGLEATITNILTSGSMYIECRTPAHARGKVDVTVVNPDGKSAVLPAAFTYMDTISPVVTGVSPASGYATGNRSVVIDGAEFSEGGQVRVLFGGEEATDVSVMSGGARVYCTTPVHAPDTVDVTVINPGGGSGTLQQAFTYVLGNPPSLRSLNILDGLESGGTPVFLEGQFFAVLGTTRVLFGEVDATEVQPIGSDRLFCIAPPHTPGKVALTVISPDGQSDTLPYAFDYLARGTRVVRVAAGNVSGIEDGNTWETAFSSIQSGVEAVRASGAPGEVWVASGTYTSLGDAVVVMEPFCDIYGGFAGDETQREQRDPAAHTTTIDGEDARACVYGADNARLDGFTVTRGRGICRADAATLSSLSSFMNQAAADRSNWIAVDNSGVSPTLSNCILVNNKPKIAVVGNFTGLDTPTSPLLENCTIADATQSEFGVLSLDGAGAPHITRMKGCTITNNATGSGMFSMNGTPCASVYQGCTFTENHRFALSAGGMGQLLSVFARNCVFARNRSQLLYPSSISGARIHFDMRNCTFADNPSARAILDGWMASGTAAFTNCIFWGNGSSIISRYSLVSVAHSDVEGGFSGTGNIDADPQFVNVAAGDYRLQPGSPCVDAGTAEDAPSVDLLGVPRPQRGGYDMGAYELPDPVPVPDVTGQEHAAAVAALKGAGFVPGTASWQYSLDVPAGTVVAQDPVAGTVLLPGTAIALVLSRGAIMVPDVTGKVQAAAAADLINAALLVGTVTQMHSATVPAGGVVAQVPAAGTPALPATAVDLTVSLGKAPVLMPDLSGMDAGLAASVLAEAGLTLGSVTHDYSTTAISGTVISQSPASGTQLPSGTPVSLVVSLGMPPVEGEPPANEGEAPGPDADAAKPLLASALAAADTNGDGSLSFDEAVSRVPELTREVFAELDVDGDGQLSQEELGADTGWFGCRGTKGAASALADLFLAGLAVTGLAAMSMVRRS